MSNLSHRKSNYWFFWWFRVVSDLSPTLGKIGHQWFCLKKWYPWWQNQWFKICYQRSHNSYKLFRRKNPPKILLTIFNFDLNVKKCPILPLFTVSSQTLLHYARPICTQHALYMTGKSAAAYPFLFTLNIVRNRTGRWLSQGVGRGFLTVWWFQGLHKIYRGKFRFQ